MKTLRRSLLALAAIAALALPSARAEAACQALPDVAWWKDGSHEAMVQTVDQRYSGDWKLYETIWTKLRDKLVTLYDEDATIKIDSEGEALHGKALRAHIGDVERKISVIRCLARVHAKPEPDMNFLADFETAAGSNEPAPQAQHGSLSTTRTATPAAFATTPRFPAAGGSAPEVKITTRCEAGVTKFRITNLGQTWPGVATFRVNNTGTGAIVSERKVRMGGGQTLSFNIQPEFSKGHGMLELQIQPSWAARGTQQAVAKCI